MNEWVKENENVWARALDIYCENCFHIDRVSVYIQMKSIHCTRTNERARLWALATNQMNFIKHLIYYEFVYNNKIPMKCFSSLIYFVIAHWSFRSDLFIICCFLYISFSFKPRFLYVWHLSLSLSLSYSFSHLVILALYTISCLRCWIYYCTST